MGPLVHNFAFTASVLFLASSFLASLHHPAGSLPIPRRSLGSTRGRAEIISDIFERQVAAGGDVAQASAAQSIYQNQGTTAFTTPTAAVLGGAATCDAGFQSYTNAAGILLCCAGSIVDNICFQDGGTLVYTLDPASVLATATATAVIPTIVTPTTSTTASTRVASTRLINTSTITSYTPTATGGTLSRTARSSTSYSKLIQTLDPTGSVASISATGKSSGARRASPSSAAGAMASVLLTALAIAFAGSVWL